MLRPPPRSPLFPYTTLFRSMQQMAAQYQQMQQMAQLQAMKPPPPTVDDHEQALRAHRSEEHTSELQSHSDLVCRLLLEKKKSTSPTLPTTATQTRVQIRWRQ